MSNVNYWMPPNKEFLPSTGCARTGQVATFHQMPRSAWSCPDEYPSLPKGSHGEYAWWKRGMADAPATSSPLLVGGLVVGAVLLGWHLVGGSERNPAYGGMLDTDQERLLDEVVLTAENDGSAYPSATKAVDRAIRDVVRYKTRGLRDDAEIIRSRALSALRKAGGGWH